MGALPGSGSGWPSLQRRASQVIHASLAASIGLITHASTVLRRRAREAVLAAGISLIILISLLHRQNAESPLFDAGDAASSPAPISGAPKAIAGEFTTPSPLLPALLPPSPSPSPSPHVHPPAVNVRPSEYATVPVTAARECNLYDYPGRLNVSSLSWTPIGSVAPGCEAERSRVTNSPASADRLANLADSSYNGRRLPPYLSNRLLLIVGDSNDRNMVSDFCWNVAGNLQYHFANGSELMDAQRAMSDSENMGDTMSCVVRPGEGDRNWGAARRREKGIQSLWEQHFAEQVQREGSASTTLLMANWKKLGQAGRNVAAANMRSQAMWNERQGGNGAAKVARGASASEAAAVQDDAGGAIEMAGNGDDVSESDPFKLFMNEPPEAYQRRWKPHWKSPPNRHHAARDDSPAADAEAFVILFVFNYGIGLNVSHLSAATHARPGNSLFFNDIVHSAGRLLDTIAPHRYPELLRMKSPEITSDIVTPPLDPPEHAVANESQAATESSKSGSRLIRPSLVVAQSSLWELIFWRHHVQNLGVTGGDEAEIDAAIQWGYDRLGDDLKITYLPSFHEVFPGSPLAWRTCPLPAQLYKFPHTVKDYNRYMVDFGRREGLRVLDWESLVEGRYWTADMIHQNVEGTLAFAQMVLAELESIHGGV
ncbi:hypothetical protein HK101_001281 [Irineochytrium annulatum]|nr:hypothetical protein HK101_001281 [Irineochytrium annulatum]